MNETFVKVNVSLIFLARDDEYASSAVECEGLDEFRNAESLYASQHSLVQHFLHSGVGLLQSLGKKFREIDTKGRILQDQPIEIFLAYLQ